MAKANFILCEQFLVLDDWRSLLQFTFDRETEFTDSTVVVRGVNHGYRRSRVLDSLGDFGMLICDRLQAELPRVFNALEISPFVPSRIEAQITASNDGDYFRGHADSGLLMFYRAITFVLYFFAEPQGFSGGNLRLYNSSEHNENDASQRQFIEITPRQNTAVFFPSDVWHEVMPVHCPDKAFRHSRFTLNGWIDR